MDFNKNLKICVIGCGSIGTEIAFAVSSGRVPNMTVRSIFDIDKARARKLLSVLNEDVIISDSITEIINDEKIDLVVECVSPSFVSNNAIEILQSGISMLILSSGALIDKNFYEKVNQACNFKDVQVYIPSGAVGGIDTIKAVKTLLKTVTIVTTKPPKALLGAPGFKEYENSIIDEKFTVFEGSAIEAVKLFPSNLNVSATISIVGVGPERTRVKVIADPNSSDNIHEIYVTSEAGDFMFKFQNKPHKTNKKTSYLAILAAIETLRSISESKLLVGT